MAWGNILAYFVSAGSMLRATEGLANSSPEGIDSGEVSTLVVTRHVEERGAHCACGLVVIEFMRFERAECTSQQNDTSSYISIRHWLRL